MSYEIKTILKVIAFFVHGFEQLPEALAALFEGKNTGKMIVSVE